MSRNESIRRSIQSGEIPMLPFERDDADRTFSELISQQDSLGSQLGDAMNQSSETWHDNAPAEAIRDESQVTASPANSVIRKLQHGRIFDYETDETEVSLGSIVDIQYGHGGKIVTAMLTGITYDVEELFPDDYEVEGVTITSPVGQAILGLSPGDSTEIVVNGRKLFLNIKNVRPFTTVFDKTNKSKGDAQQ